MIDQDLKLKRGDLVKAFIGGSAVDAADAAAESVAESVAAAAPVADAAVQYWYACCDKSIGLVTKADAIYIWVRWFGSRSDNANHMYSNDVKYFELMSQIDHE